MLDTVPWASDLASVVAAHGPRISVRDGEGTEASFSTLGARAAALAHALRARGLRPGDPVATSLRNSVAAVWAAMGLRLAGVADTPLNAALAEAERAYSLRLAKARLVVTTRAQAGAFAALGCETLAVEDVDDAGDLAALPPVPADAWGRISFTSGTTGRPKAIVTTHGARFLGALLQRASAPTAPGPGSRILLMTPFVHGAGILAQAFHERGAGCVLLDGVDLAQALPMLRAGEVDHLFAPPTVLAKLVAALDGERVGGIRAIYCGTAPLLGSLYAKARETFGPVIRLTYGKSEVNNPIAALTPAQCDEYYAEPADPEGVCVGYPGTGVEIEVRDEAGAVLRAGETGEVHLRARHMSVGHVDPDGVFHPLPPDGFHATGDLGRIDARGRLHLVGRVADVIKSGGYKIHPDEIERALAGTAGTSAVAVATLVSEYWGEVIVALAETDDATWPERARAALGGIARHKHPRAFLLWPELPRNAQGKVMRRLIREGLLARYRLIDGPYPTLEARDDVV